MESDFPGSEDLSVFPVVDDRELSEALQSAMK